MISLSFRIFCVAGFFVVEGLEEKVKDITDILKNNVFSDVKRDITVVYDVNQEEYLQRHLEFVSSSEWTVKFREWSDCRSDEENVLFVDFSEDSRILQYVDSINFNGTCKWLFLMSDVNLHRLQNFHLDETKNVYLWQLMDAGDNQPTILYHLNSIGLNGTLSLDPISAEPRKDLTGVHIRITTVHSPPFTFVQKDGSFVGYSPEVLQILQEKLNFTYDIVVPNDRKFGTMDENGTWNGMIALLIKDEADIALELQVTEPRSRVIDYSQILFHGKSALVYKKSSFKTSHVSFFKLLSNQVWYLVTGLFAAFVIMTAINIAMSKFAKRDKNGLTMDYGQCAMFVIGCLLNQNSDTEHAKWMSIKILLLTILTFGFLLLNFLCANLTSIMAVRIPSFEITSLLDVERLGFDLFIPGGTRFEQDFKMAEVGSVRQRLWEKQVSKDKKFRPDSLTETLNNFYAHPRKSAALIYEIVFDNWAFESGQTSCSLEKRTIDHDNYFALGIRKGFPYKELFDCFITQMRESGVLHNLERRWTKSIDMSRKYICSAEDKEADSASALALGFESTKLFYYIVIGGIALSIAVLMMEWCCPYVFRCAKRRKPLY